MLCGALNRGPFVVDGERASERTEEREGEEGWQRASPGGCVETPARTVVTPKSRPHPVWTPTPTPGTIISQRSQRPARRHLCYKRLLAATNQVTTARALFEITSVGRENVKVSSLNARERPLAPSVSTSSLYSGSHSRLAQSAMSHLSTEALNVI